MSHYILDKAYKTLDPVQGQMVVVFGDKVGTVRVSDFPNQGRVAGITVHSQPLVDKNVAIRKAGIARVMASEPVAYGEPVITSRRPGCVKGIYDEDSGGVYNCIGFAETSSTEPDQIIEVFLSPHVRIT